jgi:hypothetical protein
MPQPAPLQPEPNNAQVTPAADGSLLTLEVNVRAWVVGTLVVLGETATEIAEEVDEPPIEFPPPQPLNPADKISALVMAHILFTVQSSRFQGLTGARIRGKKAGGLYSESPLQQQRIRDALRC